MLNARLIAANCKHKNDYLLEPIQLSFYLGYLKKKKSIQMFIINTQDARNLS